MKILFQGGWVPGRDPEENKVPIMEYCATFGRFVVQNGHTAVLTSDRHLDKLIADEVVKESDRLGHDVKQHLMFLLPERIREIPDKGRVVRMSDRNWWIQERTFFVQQSDALVAVGGGRGTFDCVEKALLINKPVFVAGAIPSKATEAWKNAHRTYRYLADGDADFLDDVNVTATEFFTNVFRIINEIAHIAYPRRVFVVHGHDHHARDMLVDVLRRMDFDPIVLEEQASKSLTIIEKLEREINNIGFAFVLCSPDDLGRAKGGPEANRPRQNVVFEHGLLIGHLGRDRTCALIQGDLEMPSDINGLIYERIHDIRSEALVIARVLQQAGYRVDTTGLLK